MPVLRVLVITPDFPPSVGGIQRVFSRLTEEWGDLNTRVVTRSAEPGRALDTAPSCQVRRVSLGGRSHRGSIAGLNLVALHEARRFRPDIVLSGHIVVSPVARILQRIYRIPYVQYLYGKEIPARRRLTRFATNGAPATIAISRYTHALASAAGVRTDRLRIVPPGVDLPTPRSDEFSSRGERPLILTVARMTDRYKGHDTLIAALPAVKAAVPGVRWIVIGDGPLRAQYQRQAAMMGLNESVEFRGLVDDRERDQWLQRARVFAMPSRKASDGTGEGFGIAYLEAAAHGLPVVAGDVAGAREAVVDGVTGILVDPEDPARVAQAIIGLLLNSNLASALGRAGRDRAGEFAWPLIAERVMGVLQEVLDSRAA